MTYAFGPPTCRETISPDTPLPNPFPNVPSSLFVASLTEHSSHSVIPSPTPFHSVLLFLAVMVMRGNMIFASMNGIMTQMVK